MEISNVELSGNLEVEMSVTCQDKKWKPKWGETDMEWEQPNTLKTVNIVPKLPYTVGELRIQVTVATRMNLNLSIAAFEP